MTRRVAFAGPLPPPVNGFSSVCALMLDLMKARMRVEVFDRAPRQAPPLGEARQLILLVRYFVHCIGRRHVILYLALSGGRGQIIDWVYVLISKLFRRPIFIHHHSFAYINAVSRLNKAFFAWVRRDTHIVLSRNMGESLTDLYALHRGVVRVVSNAAFYDAIEEGKEPLRDDSAPLQIGFLSNITVDKGVVEFFGTLDQLKQLGVPYKAHIAGPLAPEARTIFDELLRAASDVRYIGPIYGAEKARFYRQLNIFLFPTNYANEAEPLVVYEAMRQGIYVIACDRGAIPEMLRYGAGLVFSKEEIVQSAAKEIAIFSNDRAAMASAQAMSLLQAQRIRSAAESDLENIMICMQGGIAKEKDCTGLV
jgi:glycosyltransferase involved in cell wall biosynthesis